jgi:hypothetical protein
LSNGFEKRNTDTGIIYVSCLMPNGYSAMAVGEPEKPCFSYSGLPISEVLSSIRWHLLSFASFMVRVSKWEARPCLRKAGSVYTLPI